MEALPRAILHTLAYFDAFDYPLTLPELHRYLWRAPQASLSDVAVALTSLPQVVQANGFVYLSGREQITQTRQDRYIESERKFRKRLWLLKLLTALPGVEALFIVNTLSYHNVNEQSDIDLLIVSSPKRIWSTRFYTTLLAKLMGVRPKPHHTKDALCLSFYATPNGLNQFSNLKTDADDMVEAYWIAQAMPVYDPNNYAKQLWEQNVWLREALPNVRPNQVHSNREIRSTRLQRALHALGSLVLWEPVLKWLQLMVMPKRLKQLSGPLEHSVVVLTDDVLKFHTRDPRPQLNQAIRDKVHAIQ